MKQTPWHAKLAIALSVCLPIYFAVAALGTKVGLWDWHFGLGTLTVTFGPILISVVAITALLSLIRSSLRRPRHGVMLSTIALAVPLAIFAMLVSARGQAARLPPIHDVATDTADPPQFSAKTLARRQSSGANPLNPYAVPLSRLEPWRGSDNRFASRTHAQLIAFAYPSLESIPLRSVRRSDALAAAAAAMKESGLRGVLVDTMAGRVEGTAETFWFGFTDDVVAEVRADRIDIRSTSRVGLSDLGANARRVEDLRASIVRALSS